ncbi:MAG: PD40 domain-containing protein [Firmicutes bacterium]|nr:PD40 domain-containing protein [Candidatus Fermentithermobacillaceae bacterium]
MLQTAFRVVRCSRVWTLIATLVLGLAFVIFPGCIKRPVPDGQSGPPAGNGSLEVVLKHEVAPRGLLVAGAKAYLVTENEGRFAIVEVSLPDGNERLLAEDTAQNIAVSKDGKLLAYGTASEWNAPCEVRVFDLDKGEWRKIADTTGPLRGVDFSPDGKTLVFASLEGLVTIGLDGSDRKVLVEGKANGESTVLQWRPVWSPDGAKIAYAVSYYEGSGPISIVEADTGAVLTLTISDDVDPLWSPDGKSILYTHQPYGEDHSDVYIADLAGAQPQFKRLTEGDGLYCGLGWSPDGRYVLVQRAPSLSAWEGSAMKLLVYEVGQGRFHELPATSPKSMTPTWAADGFIYYVTEDGRLTRIKPK